MSSFMLKMLGILTMTIDHLGFIFFQENLVLRFIGRLSFPLFAFQLAVGYSHSKNKEKHILKMLLFALISQIPFMIFTNIVSSVFLLNIAFTFTIGLLAMYAFENIKQPVLKFLITVCVLIMGFIIPVDYGGYGVALCFVFYALQSHKFLSIASAGALTILKIVLEQNLTKTFILYSLIPIWFYNGKKGKDMKNFFYLFYPLHMLAFAFIYYLL